MYKPLSSTNSTIAKRFPHAVLHTNEFHHLLDIQPIFRKKINVYASAFIYHYSTSKFLKTQLHPSLRYIDNSLPVLIKCLENSEFLNRHLDKFDL